jgi:hypothetical protein
VRRAVADIEAFLGREGKFSMLHVLFDAQSHFRRGGRLGAIWTTLSGTRLQDFAPLSGPSDPDFAFLPGRRLGPVFVADQR